jgi:hypothetical protein
VDSIEYPTPQGAYLVKLLKLCHSSRSRQIQPLLDVLLESRHGNKHAKEISESMAMVDALFRLSQLGNLNWTTISSPVTVYVLADGCIPSTAITLMLFMPEHWQYYSIDPLMDFDPEKHLGESFSCRLHTFKGLSQEFMLPATRMDSQSMGASTDSAGNGETILTETSDDRKMPTSTSTTTTAMRNEQNDVNNRLDSPCTEAVAAPASESAPVSVSASTSTTTAINIVIACHSHAPLQEFWDRVPQPK